MSLYVLFSFFLTKLLVIGGSKSHVLIFPPCVKEGLLRVLGTRGFPEEHFWNHLRWIFKTCLEDFSADQAKEELRVRGVWEGERVVRSLRWLRALLPAIDSETDIIDPRIKASKALLDTILSADAMHQDVSIIVDFSFVSSPTSHAVFRAPSPAREGDWLEVSSYVDLRVGPHRAYIMCNPLTAEFPSPSSSLLPGVPQVIKPPPIGLSNFEHVRENYRLTLFHNFCFDFTDNLSVQLLRVLTYHFEEKFVHPSISIGAMEKQLRDWGGVEAEDFLEEREGKGGKMERMVGIFCGTFEWDGVDRKIIEDIEYDNSRLLQQKGEHSDSVKKPVKCDKCSNSSSISEGAVQALEGGKEEVRFLFGGTLPPELSKSGACGGVRRSSLRMEEVEMEIRDEGEQEQRKGVVVPRGLVLDFPPKLTLERAESNETLSNFFPNQNTFFSRENGSLLLYADRNEEVIWDESQKFSTPFGFLENCLKISSFAESVGTFYIFDFPCSEGEIRKVRRALGGPDPPSLPFPPSPLLVCEVLPRTFRNLSSDGQEAKCRLFVEERGEGEREGEGEADKTAEGRVRLPSSWHVFLGRNMCKSYAVVFDENFELEKFQKNHNFYPWVHPPPTKKQEDILFPKEKKVEKNVSYELLLTFFMFLIFFSFTCCFRNPLKMKKFEGNQNVEMKNAKLMIPSSPFRPSGRIRTKSSNLVFSGKFFLNESRRNKF